MKNSSGSKLASSGQVASNHLGALLKYGAEIAAISDCASSANATFLGTVYRAVHQPMTSDDFVPTGIRTPGRYSEEPDAVRCKSLGLSMYTSIQKLANMILAVEKNTPNFRKLVGDHCARMPLTDVHGRRTKVSTSGHFTFFEYSTFDGMSIASQVSPLFP